MGIETPEVRQAFRDMAQKVKEDNAKLIKGLYEVEEILQRNKKRKEHLTMKKKNQMLIKIKDRILRVPGNYLMTIIIILTILNILV